MVMPLTGIVCGAVYNPLWEIVPFAGSPPVTLFTCQVTAVLAVPVTVAVNCCVAPTASETAVGEMLMAIGFAGAVTVTVALADLLESAWLTALTTMELAGTAAGAVYSPAVEIVPVVALPPVTLLTCQVTAVFAEPLMVALNCRVVPVCTLAEVGEIETLTVCPPPLPLTVTVAVAERSLLMAQTARIVTGLAGATFGAVYNPPDVMVPFALPPLTYQ